MDTTLWVVAFFILSLAELLLGLLFVPGFMPNRAQAFSESVGIRLVPELQQMVARRLSSRYIGIAIGANVGLIVGAVITVRQPAEDVFFSFILLIGMALAGVALGAALSSLLGRPRHDPDAIKYARTRIVRLDDYVPGFERWTARVGVALAVTALIVALGLGTEVALPAILTLVGVATLLFFELVGRRIVARPQQAASPRELGWDDALRSSVLRDMVVAPTVLGLFSILLTLVAIFGSVQPTSIIMVLVTTILSRLTARSRPQRHFLRRLWDAPAA